MKIVRALAGAAIVAAGLSGAANYGLGAWLHADWPGTPLRSETFETRGFPFALGFDATGIALRDGRREATLSGAEVRAPVWDPLALTIRPRLPATLSDGTLSATLNAGTASGELAFGYGLPDLPLRRAAGRVEQAQIALASAPDMPFTAASAEAALARQPAGDYAAHLRLNDIALPEGAADRLLPGADLGDRIASVSADATVGFAHPPALHGPHPELARVHLATLSIDWGGRGLSASGDLSADAAGLAEGQIALTTRDWQSWFDVARRAGLLGRGEHLVESLLRSMAEASPDGSVSIPVSFHKGRMSVGPVPTGYMLRLAQRQ